MTQPLREPLPPQTHVQPRDPEADLARRNVLLGWALFALALLIFGGTIGVALLYLALD
ncbi:MAG TPA: hypothetical protein VF101_00895 [Gaiellaceae bacterium]